MQLFAALTDGGTSSISVQLPRFFQGVLEEFGGSANAICRTVRFFQIGLRMWHISTDNGQRVASPGVRICGPISDGRSGFQKRYSRAAPASGITLSVGQSDRNFRIEGVISGRWILDRRNRPHTH
jgi:hypothetical protein